MQILKLHDIQKSEGVIYYRRQYKAIAEIEFPNRIENLPVNFTIETGPLGDKHFELEFDYNKINYPFLPLQKALREYILGIDDLGAVPL